MRRCLFVVYVQTWASRCTTRHYLANFGPEFVYIGSVVEAGQCSKKMGLETPLSFRTPLASNTEPILIVSNNPTGPPEVAWP